MKDLRELSDEELTTMLKETLSIMSKPKVIAVCLMSGIPTLIEWARKYHNRDDFMAALEVLERVNRKYPGDKDCQAAIEFVRRTFP